MAAGILGALISALRAKLRADTTLQTTMGGSVDVYLEVAPSGASFPYIVHWLDEADDGPFSNTTYNLNIYAKDDTNPGQQTVLEAYDRIKALLKNEQITLSGSEAGAVICTLIFGTPMGDEDETVARFDTSWRLRYVPTRDYTAIDAR